VLGVRPAVDDSVRTALFRIMVLIRAFHDAVRKECAAAGARPPASALVHRREGVAAGVGSHLGADDAVTAAGPTYDLALASGIGIGALVKEAVDAAHGHGKEQPDPPAPDSTSGPVSGPTAAEGYFPALGRAFSFQQRGSEQIAVALVDRVVADGEGFASAVGLANLWKLPILFVVEDQYGETTRPPGDEKAAVAPLTASDIPVERVDSNAVEEIYQAAGHAVRQARSGGGPSIVEVTHVGVRLEVVRTTGGDRPGTHDVEAQDPLPTYESVLREQGIVDDELAAQIRTTVAYRVAEALNAVVECHRSGPDSCAVCARKAAS
jgi:acetoin:2,6-dichlorophenolindophenol oxidoreductase subunit alpha